ncbi:MAG: hypothetical protein ACPG4Y_08635 [Chitinophagales bacterium]
MKTRIFTILLVLINSSVFAQEAVTKADPSAMQQTLSGRPLLTSFFFSVFAVLIIALYVAIRTFYSNKAKA